MTTSKKLWLGFGTLTALLVLFSGTMIVLLRSIAEQAKEMVNVAKPRSVATRELEINVLGYALAVRVFIQIDDPKFRQEAAERAADVERHLADYERLATTERQRELAARFAVLWQGFTKLSQAALSSKDRPLERKHSERMAELRLGLEQFLDDEMQPDAVETHMAHKEVTLGIVQTSVVLAVILLLVGVVIAVMTSWAVGRGIVNGERQLWNSREELRITLASIGEAVITTDSVGRITYLNAVAETLTGWTTRDLVGQPLDDVLPIINEDSRQRVENSATRALREGVIVGMAYHAILIAKDGTERLIDDCAAPIRNERGRTVGCVMTFRDVSERRRTEVALRKSQDRYELAVRGSNDGIWDWDVRTNQCYYSDRYFELWGFGPGELAATHETWEGRLHPDDCDRVTSAQRLHLAMCVPYDVEYRAQIKSGQWRWYRSRGQAVWDENGQAFRMAGSMTDITERKRAEEQLQVLNATLEEQIAQRTGELAQINAALQAEMQEREKIETQLQQSKKM